MGPSSLPLGRDSVTAQVTRHPLVYLGGPRALLMELAHPVVAKAVADHSTFESDPMARLARTLRIMGEIQFGSPARSRSAAAGLRRTHDRFIGVDTEGRPYRANHPDLLLWVHATLVDTLLAVERRYLGLLDERGRESLYAESRLVAAALGIPKDGIPADLAAFTDYVGTACEDLEVTEEARHAAGAILHPRLPGMSHQVAVPAERALAPWIAAVTADLLPSGLRRAYGLESPVLVASSWGIDLGAALTRTVAPRVPAPLLVPLTRWAARLIGAPETAVAGR